MRRLLWVVATTAAVLALLAWYAHARGWILGSNAEPPPSQDLSHGRQDRLGVFALGRIVPRDGILELCGGMGDELAECRVAEGDVVEQGQTLAVLGSRALRELELAAARSQLAEAQARAAAEAATADARIAAAELAIEQAEAIDLDIEAQRKRGELAEANLAVAKKDLERLEGLSRELVTEQQLDHQRLVVRQAQSESDAASALVRKLLRGRELKWKAANQELAAAKESKPKLLAAIPAASLERACELKQAQLDRASILAPADGTVLRVFVQPGEVIGREPVLQMANLDHMAVVAEVYEADVQRVQLGQPAIVRSPAFRPPHDADGLCGAVTRIGQIIAAPLLADPNPLATVDRHVIEVRIELDKESARQAAQLINLQVDVFFPADDGAARKDDSRALLEESEPGGD